MKRREVLARKRERKHIEKLKRDYFNGDNQPEEYEEDEVDAYGFTAKDKAKGLKGAVF